MPDKFILRNVSGRALKITSPIALALKAGEERPVFLSPIQAGTLRQNPGEVALEPVKVVAPAAADLPEMPPEIEAPPDQDFELVDELPIDDDKPSKRGSKR